MKRYTHLAGTLLPCYICTKLDEGFYAEQTVHLLTLDNGLSKVTIPCCCQHQRLSNKRLEDIIRGGGE